MKKCISTKMIMGLRFMPIILSVHLFLNTAASAQCIADFTAEVISGCAPLTVTFTDNSQGATSWSWSFPGGDPSTVTGQGPHTVTYNAPGSYDVTLDIRCLEALDSKTKNNYIIVEDCACEANFGADQTSGCAPLTVTFEDASQNAISWSWNFPGGDPSSATGQGPHTVTYNASESYDVTLDIECPGASDSETKNNYITVNDCEPDLDFGDAPDPTYPTLLQSNGARHVIVQRTYLGSSVDADPDGQPNASATGDDNDGNNDEDGVIIQAALTPGQVCSVQVTASVAGTLNAWVDFDINGDWADPAEQIFTNQSLNYGLNTLGFQVPAGAKSGPTFARFRFSTVGGLSFDGEAPDGEVEDYQVEIYPPELDFGDAPDPSYPTLLASNGAYHIIGGPWLGDSTDVPDPDTNGQQNAYADGDDLDGNDDERGVSLLPWWLILGETTFKEVEINGGGGFLQVWVDLNCDGTWQHPGEQIFTGFLNDGKHTIPVTMPFGISARCTFGRFRISSQGGLAPWGPASDGEVEDYYWEIKFLDWGDAPDPSYPTLATNNGARHGFTLPPQLYLGSIVDAELDGQPDANALGDDNDGWDDEDGVIIPLLVPGQQANITVVVGKGGYLDGWIDFDNDGTWQHPGEQIFGDSLPGGSHIISIAVPNSAVPGTTFARFRISPEGGLTPEGYADEGEVEDYQVEIRQLMDYGDAPDPTYPTLLGSNGARHVIKGPWLGDNDDVPDPDTNGQPDPNALGDDNDGNDDEDGVTIPVLTQGQPANITVQVSGGGGVVAAWIDWNGDSTWQHKGEQIYNSYLADGSHTITVTPPINSVIGQTFARFRICSDDELSPDGSEFNGEVEDYEVVIEEGVEGVIKWSQPPTLSTESQYPDCFWGWDELSVYTIQIVADDWFCVDARPITDVHWWGSYREWDAIEPPQNAPWMFHIGIWTDVPAGVDQQFSHPGEMIREWRVDRSDVNETYVGCDFHPDYLESPDACFRYEFIIPNEEWFYQEADSTIYWISISAIYEHEQVPEQHLWGWKTRQHYFQDDAVRIFDPTVPVPGSQFAMGEPIEDLAGNSWDMAFELTSTEEADTFDFGDAPDPSYPTLFANNGARHVIDPNLYLGGSVDADPDGQPDTHALGDDNDGSDDEDGVALPPTLMQGDTVNVTVTASDSGVLNAWIDFNADGDWADPGEQIFITQPLIPGTNTQSFIVPINAAPDTTFARFRFSSVRALSYYGEAQDGEVEDYAVVIEEREFEHKMHWPQLPDPHGWDVNGTFPNFLADDFLCTETGFITDITFWGSWQYDRIGEIQLIIVSILNNDTTGPFSKPHLIGPCVSFVMDTTDFKITPVYPTSPQGWFDPNTGEYQQNDHEHYFRYDFKIPQPDCPQEQGMIYWLAIAVQTKNGIWGWKTSRSEQFEDDAVWADTSFSWQELRDPLTGESLDLAFVINSIPGELDFGDAPDPKYPTLRANDGARHMISGLWLGGPTDAPDGDADGQPDPNALGDDNDGNDDENGVVFTTALVPGDSANINVTASGSGYLNAWIDFNANGDWADTGEHVFVDEPLAPGTDTLTFNVPISAVPDTTFARFRFNTYGGLSFKGLARDGEVEDYEVIIVSPTGAEDRPEDKQIPFEFALLQSYPNPFSPITEIRYELPKAEHVRLSIINLVGQELIVLVNERKSPGRHAVSWDGRDESGRQVPNGIYFCRMRAGSFTEVKKLLLVK